MANYIVYGCLPITVYIDAKSEEEAFDKAELLQEDILKEIVKKSDRKDIVLKDIEFVDYEYNE